MMTEFSFLDKLFLKGLNDTQYHPVYSSFVVCHFKRLSF